MKIRSILLGVLGVLGTIGAFALAVLGRRPRRPDEPPGAPVWRHEAEAEHAQAEAHRQQVEERLEPLREVAGQPAGDARSKQLADLANRRR